jgi:hypothetical protein
VGANMNRLVDLDDILYAGESILFNYIALTIPKWPSFKILRWVFLNQLVDLDEILYGGDEHEGDVDHSKMADV